MLVYAPASLGTATALIQDPENLCFCGWKVDTAMLTTNGSIKGIPIFDASARGVVVRDADSGATCKCLLLGADVSMGGLGAPVAGEFGLRGRLIELHDKGLKLLPISIETTCATASPSK